MNKTNHSQPQPRDATKTGDHNPGCKIHAPFWLAMGCLLLGVSFSAFAQDTDGQDDGMSISHHVFMPEVGRFQMAVDRKDENTAMLYVMDTATGKVIRKNIEGWKPQWEPVLTTLSPSTFDDVIGAYERKENAEEQRQKEVNAAYTQIWASFCAAKLEEQVKMAESILVLQFTSTPAKLSVIGDQVVHSGGESFRVTDVLKGPRISSVKNRTLSQAPESIEWRPSVEPFVYPVYGHDNLFLSHAIREAQREQQKELEVGETVIYFAIPNEQYNIHVQFIMAREQLHFPEHMSQYETLSTPRDPAELIADIKAILERKEW